MTDLDQKTGWSSEQKPPTPASRWRRVGLSNLGLLLAPFARLFRRYLAPLQTRERREQGLVIILNGIEGESFMSPSIAWGLADAGWQGAVEIFDWTTGWPLLGLYHLRHRGRNQLQARELAEKVRHYQREFPDRPIYLIGHSGGAAIVVWALEELAESESITAAVLLTPALGPRYSLAKALQRAENGLLVVSSYGDALLCGIGTTLCGTMDGHWRPAAGMVGFSLPGSLDADDLTSYQNKLHALPYHPAMLRSFYLGGHFSCTNRVFIAEWVAPWLREETLQKPAKSADRSAAGDLANSAN